jgi:hypothetical protein
MRKPWTELPRILLLAGLLVVPATAIAADTAQAPPAVDPAALDALDRMGAYLRTITTFEVRSKTTLDDVLDSGQKLQFDGTAHLRVRRPDRLWAEVASDRKVREFFYDGKTFTIYGPRNHLYATVPAPATLHEVVTKVEERYGLVLPLADLFRWGTDPLQRDAIREAIYVGPARVGGDPCEQLAFRQDGIDWQIWIQKGDSPLPRKLVITTTDDESQPQYTAVLDWNLAPALNDAMFTFTPPAGSYKINIQELTAQPASGGN